LSVLVRLNQELIAVSQQLPDTDIIRSEQTSILSSTQANLSP